MLGTLTQITAFCPNESTIQSSMAKLPDVSVKRTSSPSGSELAKLKVFWLEQLLLGTLKVRPKAELSIVIAFTGRRIKSHLADYLAFNYSTIRLKVEFK